MPSLLIVFFLGLTLSFSGCASKVEPLELQNVLELRSERVEAKNAKEQAKAAATAAPSPSPTPKATPSPTVFKFNPPELAELSLPKNFTRLTPIEIESPVLQDRLKEIFTGITTGWKKNESDVVAVASTNSLDPDKLSYMTKKIFLTEIKAIAQQYDAYYRKKYGAPTVTEVKEEPNLVSIKVSAKYPQNGKWRTDLRYIFIYKPEYRLNLLFTGSDTDFGDSWKELEPAVKTFSEKLRVFSKPILFQKEPEDV